VPGPRPSLSPVTARSPRAATAVTRRSGFRVDPSLPWFQVSRRLNFKAPRVGRARPGVGIQVSSADSDLLNPSHNLQGCTLPSHVNHTSNSAGPAAEPEPGHPGNSNAARGPRVLAAPSRYWPTIDAPGPWWRMAVMLHPRDGGSTFQNIILPAYKKRSRIMKLEMPPGHVNHLRRYSGSVYDPMRYHNSLF
jgi:hypothetical protein